MRIFIVGPMASGKSTLGKKLAQTLNIDFVDTDREIEKKAGAEISWIFEVEGEKGFRERERKALKKFYLHKTRIFLPCCKFFLAYKLEKYLLSF